jgi:hypothetical protein
MISVPNLKQMPLKKSASEDGYETVMIAFVLTAKFGKK